MNKTKTLMTTISGIVPILTCTILGIIFIVLIGCPEAQQVMKPIVTDEPADTPPTTVGEVKKPKEEETPVKEPVEPEEPPPPADTTPPTVVEVGWYHDWRLEESVTDDVRPGDTIYTVVTFSEPVQHTVADNETALPALSIVIDGAAVQYQMLLHGAKIKNGEAKPLRDGTDDFICKYTIPADASGTVALHVGAESTDSIGNAVAEVSEHLAPFVVAEPESTITLPPGYELPPELIPTRPTVLSENERALMEADEIRGYDVLALKSYNTGSNADIISLLPYKDREEVYELFVRSVSLPSFRKAAEKMKEVNITLTTINPTGENRAARDEYVSKAWQERGLVGERGLVILKDIYFEENPEHERYRKTGHSNYWIILEYYRLQLEHPDLPNLPDMFYEGISAEEILNLFRESAGRGYIFGLENPWG